MWPVILSVSSAMFGTVIALLGAWWNHWLTESRERKKRVEEYRLDLYVDVVGMIVKIEEYRAKRGRDPDFMSLDDQSQEIRIVHRLRLIGSETVIQAYMSYREAVFDQLDRSLDSNSIPTCSIDREKEKLIREMRMDFTDLLARPKSFWGHIASVRFENLESARINFLPAASFQTPNVDSRTS